MTTVIQDDLEIYYHSKKSFNAPSDDNDAVEELYSSLEIEGPDAEVPDAEVPGESSASSSAPLALDLSTDEAVEVFELTAKNKKLFLDAMNDPAVQSRFCRMWERRLSAYFSRCLTAIPEDEVCPPVRQMSSILT